MINRKAPEGEYVTSWDEFAFLPRALDGLRRLARDDTPLVVVTNQRGIARGRMSEADLDDIHRCMWAAIDAAGGRLDAIYHCPHEGGCSCRKPRTGLYERAAADLGIDLQRSAVIGDRASDMQAATAIGALRVLVRGYDEPMPEVDYAADDLPAAAHWLAGQSASRSSSSSAS